MVLRQKKEEPTVLYEVSQTVSVVAKLTVRNFQTIFSTINRSPKKRIIHTLSHRAVEMSLD